jgi:hypothetical protein
MQTRLFVIGLSCRGKSCSTDEELLCVGCLTSHLPSVMSQGLFPATLASWCAWASFNFRSAFGLPVVWLSLSICHLSVDRVCLSTLASESLLAHPLCLVVFSCLCDRRRRTMAPRLWCRAPGASRSGSSSTATSLASAASAAPPRTSARPRLTSLCFALLAYPADQSQPPHPPVLP